MNRVYCKSIDHIGSVMTMQDKGFDNLEYYNYDAWGRDVGTPPSTANLVKYTGARVEVFAGGGASEPIYKMGVRH